MALGPNDIEAKFVLKDDFTAAMKNIDNAIKKTTDDAKKKSKETQKTFDGWNFAVQVLTKSFHLFFNVFRQNEDFREFTDSLRDFTANRADFSFLHDITKNLDETNAIDKLNQLIKKRSELAEAMGRHAKDGNLMILPAESAAAEQRQKFWQDQINILANAIGIQERIRKQAASDKDVEFFKSIGLDEGQIKKLTTVPIMSWSEALEVAKGETDTWKKSQDAMNQSLIDFDDVMASAPDWLDSLRQIREEFDFGEGFHKAVDEMEADFQHLGNVAQRFARETQSTISTDLFDALTGKAIRFTDFLSHLLLNVLKQVTDATASGFLGLFGLGGGSGSGGILSKLFGGGNSASGGQEALPSYGSNEPTFGGAHAAGAVGLRFSKPTMIMVGEGGEPETVDIVPDSKRGTMGRGSVTVHNSFTIHALDPRGVSQLLTSREAQDTIAGSIINATNRRDVRAALGL